MSEREEILANFQSITGIDNVTQAIEILEATNWDLNEAYQIAPAYHNPSIPSEVVDVSIESANERNYAQSAAFITDDDVIPMDPSSQSNNIAKSFHTNMGAAAFDFDLLGFTSSDFMEGPSTSSTSIIDFTNDLEERSIDVTVQHERNMYKITIPEYATVGDLKIEIQSRTKVPINQQLLSGWKYSHNNMIREPITNSSILKNYTSKDTILRLEIELPQLIDLTSNIVRPNVLMSGSSSSMPMIDVDFPVDDGHHSRDLNKMEIIGSDSDAEQDDDIEAHVDDSEYMDAYHTNHLCKNLIPDNIESDQLGSDTFVLNYSKRFNDTSNPDFFVGSLESAVNEAFKKSAKDRKLLALYLHNDNSVSANIFCSKTLGDENIRENLNSNFILYGWDLTHENNKQMLLSSIAGCINSETAQHVLGIPVAKLPAILIFSKTRGRIDLIKSINDHVDRSIVLQNLEDAVTVFKDQQVLEIREEDDREARRRMKEDQDWEFNQSLLRDQEKEEAKRQKEMMQEKERQRLESEKAEYEAKFEALRSVAESSLPPEPPAGQKDVTSIRVTNPDGQFFQRRFTTDTKLEILINYVVSQGFLEDQYKIITHPRRDLTEMTAEDRQKTLKELQLIGCVLRLAQR